VKQKRKQKLSGKPPKDAGLADERSKRGQAGGASPADQLGATEQDVQPLTPPPADTPERQPMLPRKRYVSDAEDEIDPADELTPG